MSVDYKKSVGVFGFALPLGFLLVLMLGLLIGKSWVSKRYQQKSTAYEQSQNRQRQIAQLDKKVKVQRERLSQWKSLIDQGSRRAVMNQWKAAGASFKAKEFKMDLPIWKNKSSGLGAGVNQPSTQVSISFVATYRAMQLALLNVETYFPQMQLDSLQMTPSKDGYTLNVKTTHTIWTKN